MKMAELEFIRKIKKKYERSWLSIEGVVAVGIGHTTGEVPGIIVSVKENPGRFRQSIPAEVEGVPVEIRETGEIRAR
jgi:hypothetical protein